MADPGPYGRILIIYIDNYTVWSVLTPKSGITFVEANGCNHFTQIVYKTIIESQKYTNRVFNFRMSIHRKAAFNMAIKSPLLFVDWS